MIRQKVMMMLSSDYLLWCRHLACGISCAGWKPAPQKIDFLPFRQTWAIIFLSISKKRNQINGRLKIVSKRRLHLNGRDLRNRRNFFVRTGEAAAYTIIDKTQFSYAEFKPIRRIRNKA